MPVDVKSYLASMKSISSQTASNIKNGVANQQDLKMQALLAQLIEALSYAKSMDLRQKTLNAPAIGSKDKTAREILDIMKSQEKLVKQLASGQALSKEQGEKLTKAIDKFYEMAGTAEVNYKKFAEHMERFAMEDLPEAVKTRVINDSREAHIIGKNQLDKENPVINTLKKIKNYVEDTVENTKQFRKKLFVTLDQFKEGFLDGLDKLGEAFENSGFFNNLLKSLSSLGALGLVLQGFTKEGSYGIPALVKQFFNLKEAFKAFKEVGGLGKGIAKSFETVGNMIKGFKGIIQQFKFLPKLIQKFGLGKGLGAAAKGIGKGLAKGLGKNALKKIPVLGSLLSIGFAISRWKQGDKVGALIEIASGIAAIFPGIGTLVSIGLDLINLGRDSGFFKNIKENIKDKVSSVVPKLSENSLLTLPIIGPMIGLKKAFDLWQGDDKLGAIKMVAKSGLASLLPGGAWLFDLFEKLLSEDWNKPEASMSSGLGSGGSLITESGLGSATSSIAQYGEGESSSSTSDFGTKLANAANAAKLSKSSGSCGKYVGNAVEKVLGKKVAGSLRGHGKDWASKLQGPVGKKYFNSLGQVKKWDRLPAGSIISWLAAPGHPYGHVEISDGKGHLISDFSRDASKYPANGYIGRQPFAFVPKDVDYSLIASTTNDYITKETAPNTSLVDSEVTSGLDVEDTEASNIQTYDDALSAYTSFMDNIQSQISGIEGSKTISGKSWISDTTKIPELSKTTKETTIPATTAVSSIAQAQSPSFVTASSQTQTSSMTTDIQDTALAILNSVLFK